MSGESTGGAGGVSLQTGVGTAPPHCRRIGVPLTFCLPLRTHHVPTSDGFFEVDDSDAIDAIDRMIRAADNLTAPFREVAKLLEDDVATAFAQEATPTGTAWPELDAATIAEKERLGYGEEGKVQREGTLFGSLSAVADSGGVSLVTSDNPGKAGAQNRGTTRAGKGNNTTIPARTFADVKPETAEVAAYLVADHVIAAAR